MNPASPRSFSTASCSSLSSLSCFDRRSTCSRHVVSPSLESHFSRAGISCVPANRFAKSNMKFTSASEFARRMRPMMGSMSGNPFGSIRANENACPGMPARISGTCCSIWPSSGQHSISGNASTAFWSPANVAGLFSTRNAFICS